MQDSDIKAKLNELELRVQALESSSQLPAHGGSVDKKQSLREFLNEKQPTTANDRGLCVAYFCEAVKGFESFNADDIKSGFREARIPVPKNPNDVINKNINKAYMMDAESSKEGKKAWVLTHTGLEAVKKGFGKEK